MMKKDFNNLLASIKQAGLIRSGKLKPGRMYTFDSLEVKAIRKNLLQSQGEFAGMIGVSVATLRNWEQGRRYPRGPARALLKIAQVDPRAVLRALHTT